MLQRIGDSHCVMEHAGLFRVIGLVHLIVCSHVGLLKIVAFEIYQTEYYNFEIWDLAMVAVEMAPGRSGSSGESCVRCVDVLFSGAKDGLCGVSHTKLIGKVIICVRFIYKGVSQYWE